MVPPTRPTIGPYRIERELGGCAGPLTAVYLAHDTRADRPVVLRPLPEEVTADPERLQRFEREMRLLASLSHPNVEAIYGVEEDSGRRFLVLERVEGAALAQRLEGGPLSIEETIRTCVQIAAGMEAAHKCGIVHGDLRPGDIVITPDGQVKIVNFDFLLRRGHEGDQPLGTLPYLSPERLEGKSVDPRSEIWSFGCIVYECLTAKRAFQGPTCSALIPQIFAGKVDWSQLPEQTPARMRKLLAHCLAKDPMRRLRNMGDARLALEEMWAGFRNAKR